MTEKKPKRDDAVLGGQIQTPTNGAILGGIEGAKQRLLKAHNQQAYQAACAELAKYLNGEALLREWAIRRCVAITRDSDGVYKVHRYQQVRHLKFNSLYWHPELNSPFVAQHLKGKEFTTFSRFDDAKKLAVDVATEKEPLLWGVGPWVKADYGWLPSDSKLVSWQNLFDGNPLLKDGQVLHRTGKKRLQDLGRLVSGDPDQLVFNKAHITSNRPMYLWFV